jgi:hypothetical protein
VRKRRRAVRRLSRACRLVVGMHENESGSGATAGRAVRWRIGGWKSPEERTMAGMREKQWRGRARDGRGGQLGHTFVWLGRGAGRGVREQQEEAQERRRKSRSRSKRQRHEARREEEELRVRQLCGEGTVWTSGLAFFLLVELRVAGWRAAG